MTVNFVVLYCNASEAPQGITTLVENQSIHTAIESFSLASNGIDMCSDWSSLSVWNDWSQTWMRLIKNQHIPLPSGRFHNHGKVTSVTVSLKFARIYLYKASWLHSANDLHIDRYQQKPMIWELSVEWLLNHSFFLIYHYFVTADSLHRTAVVLSIPRLCPEKLAFPRSASKLLLLSQH